MVGLVGSQRRTVQIEDARSDPRYQWQEALALGELRTILGVPMLIAGQATGVIVLTRHQVDPFDDRTIGLVTTFAAQGAIAIQNVQLFKSCRQKRRADAVASARAGGAGRDQPGGQLQPRPQQVLTTIVTRAVELSGAEGGSIFEFDDETQGVPGADVLRHQPSSWSRRCGRRASTSDETFVGRAARQPASRARRPTSRWSRRDPHIDHAPRRGVAVDAGRPAAARATRSSARWSCAGAVPGGFSERTVELMETFASQSAMAIHNARVFRELEEKTRELEVASRAQVRVPRQHVARAAHAAERRHRLLGCAARAHVRRAQRAAGGVPPGHPRLRPAPARADQRDPRPLEGRGGADGAGAGAGVAGRAARASSMRDGPRAGAAHGTSLAARDRSRRRRRLGRRAAG